MAHAAASNAAQLVTTDLKAATLTVRTTPEGWEIIARGREGQVMIAVDEDERKFLVYMLNPRARLVQD